MALKLYNPRTQTFVSFTPPVSDLPLSEMLLLNILIEMQAQTFLMQEQSPNLPPDPAEVIRASIVSEI